MNGTDTGSALQLESRFLLARASIFPQTGIIPGQPLPAIHLNRSVGHTDRINQAPRNYVQTFVASGGKTAVLINTNGALYAVHVLGPGTVRAKAAPQGKVDLFLYGTNVNTTVSIDPTIPTPGQGTAHQFPTGTTLHDGLVQVRNVTVVNGKIGQILGYKTADLSGALVVASQNEPGPYVDRIAFNSLQPGASIEVPGTLFTLDVYNSIFLDGGTGIAIGQDLDAMNVGTTLSLVNGASVRVGRDLGAVVQQAKGSGPVGIGMTINGDLIVNTGGTISVGRFFGIAVPSTNIPIVVKGSSFGITNLPLNVQQNTVVYGNRG
jgi:hypothetical protein